MKENLKKFKAKEFIILFFEIFLIFVILFGRSFTGLYLFGFRLGELMIGLSLVLFLYILYLYINKKFDYLPKKVVQTQLYLVALFLIINLINQTYFTDLYIFKSSSFIWTSFYFYIGIIYAKVKNENVRYLNLLSSSTYIVYILSSVHFPDFLWNIFLNYSDKVDFLKGSDLLLIFVLTNYLNKKYQKNRIIYLYNFFISSGLLLPILLFKSKGAFLPASIYVFVELILIYKFLWKNKLNSLIAIVLSMFVFSLSTLYIWGNFSFDKNPDSPNIIISNLANTGDAIQEISEEKNTIDAIFSLYYNPLNNRLMSTENMANWRLLIWQDVYWDLIENNKLLFGYGFENKIPAMEQRDRQGWDGENEHVHNFAINILARTGLIGLSMMLIFYYLLFREFLSEKKNFKDILLFIVPVLITASFDPALESVRFPFIYYFFLGLFYHDRNVNILDKH